MIEIVATIGVILMGIIGVLFKQRNNARRGRDDAKRQEQMHKTAIEQKVRIEQNREKVRRESEKTQHEANERPTSQRPSGNFPG